MVGSRLLRRAVTTSVLTLVASTGAAVPTALAEPAAAAPAEATPAATWAADPSRPFSDPLWLPLRDPARVSCTYTNCPLDSGNVYHGYWAIDFLGELGDPLYAAGAGVVHVGASDPGCRTGTTEASGTWVWIDHGAGLVTKYNHLDTITVRDGQLVTPSTQIGTMGHSGDHAPCTTDYLHFEVRTGGVTGPRIDPKRLYGCQGGTRLSFPNAWGETSWNDLGKVEFSTPQLDNSCLPSASSTSSAPASLSARRGDRTATLTWTPPATTPAPVDRYAISMEVWGPSVGAWHSMSYRAVPAGSLSTTISGLENGRTYRFRVLAHTPAGTRSVGGNSAWTAYAKATPATAPLAPRTDRNLTPGTTYVRFGWYGAVPQGTPVTSYTARIRYWTGSAWSAWSSVEVPAAELTHRWDGLRRGTTYQVTVRATSDAGSSPWGISRKLTTLR